MPFRIENSAIQGASNGGEAPGHSKSKNSNRERVLFRGKLEFQSEARSVIAFHERQKQIESCGCDAVMNLPYRPLGSMESVLKLRVEKEQPESKMDRKVTPAMLDLRIEKEQTQSEMKMMSTRNHQSLPPEVQEPSAVRIGRSDENDEEKKHGQKAIVEALFNIRRKYRQNTKSYHSMGFRDISKCVREGEHRIRGVKAGRAYFSFIDKQLPLERAKWASENASQLLNSDRASRPLQEYGLKPKHGSDDSKSLKKASDGTFNPPGNMFEKTRKSRPSQSLHGGFSQNSVNGIKSNVEQSAMFDLQPSGHHKRTNLKMELEKLEAKLHAERPKEDKRHPGFSSRFASKRAFRMKSSTNTLYSSKRPDTSSMKAKTRQGSRASSILGTDPEKKTSRQGKDASQGVMFASVALEEHSSENQAVSLQGEKQVRKKSNGNNNDDDISRPAKSNHLTKSSHKMRKIPPYVLHVTKRPQLSEQVEKIMAQARVPGNINASEPCRPSTCTGGVAPNKDGLSGSSNKTTTGNGCGDLNSGSNAERTFQSVNPSLDGKDSTNQAQVRIVGKSEDFIKSRAELYEKLRNNLELQAFTRPDNYRRKLLAFDLALKRTSSGMDDFAHDTDMDSQSSLVREELGRPGAFGVSSTRETRNDLARMRSCAKKLEDVQVEYNLSQSKWFTSLLLRSQDSGRPLSLPEQKLLAALRQLIVEGWKLNKALFQDVLLQALTKDDHRSVPLQRLISIVRDQVLRMDIEKYHKFLKRNELPIPQAVLDKVQAVRFKKDHDGAPTSKAADALYRGFKTATIALKWNRQTRGGS